MNTYLHVAQIGVAYFVFRVEAARETDPDYMPERLPGVHASKVAANKAARRMAREAGKGEVVR